MLSQIRLLNLLPMVWITVVKKKKERKGKNEMEGRERKPRIQRLKQKVDRSNVSETEIGYPEGVSHFLQQFIISKKPTLPTAGANSILLMQVDFSPGTAENSATCSQPYRKYLLASLLRSTFVTYLWLKKEYKTSHTTAFGKCPLAHLEASPVHHRWLGKSLLALLSLIDRFRL